MSKTFMKTVEETLLTGYLKIEIVNHKSVYYGEEFYVTSWTNAVGGKWYRVLMDYVIPKSDNLWFKSDEFEVLEGEL